MVKEVFVLKKFIVKMYYIFCVYNESKVNLVAVNYAVHVQSTMCKYHMLSNK